MALLLHMPNYHLRQVAKLNTVTFHNNWYA